VVVVVVAEILLVVEGGACVKVLDEPTAVTHLRHVQRHAFVEIEK
jgi:hypothetical protein